MPRIAKLYMILVVALGLWVLLNHGGLSNAEQFVGLAVFSILGIVFEAASIDIPGSKITVSVSFVPVLTSIFLFGPSVGVWVGALSTLSYRDIFGGKPILKNAFNFSQLGIAAWVAGQAFLLAGGRPGEISLTDPVPVGVCVIAYMFANALFSSLGIGFIQGVHPHTVFSRLIAWSVPSFVAMSPLSALAALIQLHVGYLGVLLFVLPLLLARMSLRLYRDMRQNYVETIQSLAQAIDAKDHYTRGHSERVAFYAVEIARKLGWSQLKQDQLYFLALLHDVGKIGITEQILNKRGRLTEEERQDVNRHPELGASIIEKVGFLRRDAGFVRHHHEHYSGAGYPDGLAGDNIPVGARIIGVADAFDAMTSQRVYHPARSAFEALEELHRCSGVQFDPLVVEAFDALMHERADIIKTANEAATTEWTSLAGASR